MEPQPRIGLAELTKTAYAGIDLAPLRAQLLLHCLQSPDHAGALMDMSVIDQLHGDKDTGLEWQSKAFETCRLFRTQPAPTTHRAGRTVLVFAAPSDIGGNTPVEFLLRDGAFDIITYFPKVEAPEGATLPLPPHDIAFCAAPLDAEGAGRFFDHVRDCARRTGTKVVNLPPPRLDLGRTALPALLAGIPGLRVPATCRESRTALLALAQGGEPGALIARLGPAPWLIRPVGSHAGRGLAKLNGVADLAAYLSAHMDAAFDLSAFIDYASAGDGLFRKARLVFVDGQPFPCHLAIADRWDIWYLNSDMQASEAKRREEAAFMDRFADDFAARHAPALAGLAEAVGLDYFGVDCAEDRAGNLVVFEADNALIVHDMDCEATFPYKKPHMARIFAAFEALLLRGCAPAQNGAARGPCS